MKGKRFFFTTDAVNSYRAIPVCLGDESKLGFVTSYGKYCYKVMCQGLTETLTLTVDFGIGFLD